MTEEIIIDDIDVAGCVRLQDDKISCDLGGECNGWENCYYKQLKRLEQENKELQAYKDINEDFKKAWGELNEKYKQLRSALEKIGGIAEKSIEISYNLEVNSMLYDIIYKINKVLQ